MADFGEILALLPEAGECPSLTGEVPGVEYVGEAEKNFVEPSLEAVDDGEIDPGATRLVLVSAPAAVGKTTLAKQIAARRSGVFWDLGKSNVGDSFFAGQVLASFGTKAGAGFLEAAFRGEALVVMDALDEARIRAGEDNFDAFVHTLAIQLNEQEPTLPPVVLLARTETAEWTRLLADDLALPTAHYSIAYFDKSQAEEFIDLRLDQEESPSHRKHREAFVEARMLLFKRVFEVLEVDDWDAEEARSFLGYAPVLEALSEYLNESNYAALKTDIAKTGNEGVTEQSIWRFLIGIVERILAREQGKLRTNLPDALRKKIDEKEIQALYGSDEQCERLASHVLGNSAVDTDLPADAREEYEQAVQQILSEHPFLATSTQFASAVFGDYVWAHALRKGSVAHRHGVRTHLESSEARPSPLLARFMIEMGGEGTKAESISLADFPIFYESIRGEEVPGKPVGLSITEDQGQLSAVVRPSNESSGGYSLYLAPDGADSLAFLRRLSQADIVLDSTPLRLGRASEEFAIGPNVSVSAPEVLIGCRVLRVEARHSEESPRSEAEGVLIAPGKLRSETPNPEVRVAPAAKLEIVTAESLPHPWAGYRAQPTPPSPDADALLPHLNDLARLLSWFKAQGYESPGVHAKPIETLAAKGRLSQGMLDYAKQRGLVVTDGKMLRLDLDAVPLNFQHVKAGLLDKPAIEFLQGYRAR